jgi:hypothetical protein
MSEIFLEAKDHKTIAKCITFFKTSQYFIGDITQVTDELDIARSDLFQPDYASSFTPDYRESAQSDTRRAKS